jgi:hypothetical protein
MCNPFPLAIIDKPLLGYSITTVNSNVNDYLAEIKGKKKKSRNHDQILSQENANGS